MDKETNEDINEDVNENIGREISKDKEKLNIDSEKSDILIKTAKEYFNAAEDEFNKSRYNSSVVLYFKSLVALVDLFILQKTGDTPSSHHDRFRTTERDFPEVYDLLDKDFPFYQDSYF